MTEHVGGCNDRCDESGHYLAAANTDRELYREGGGDGNGMSYYEPSIHVTEHGAIGINVDGHVITTSIRGWHEMATGRDALVRQAKAEAMRSQADFFRAVDMDAAADHCEQAAIAYEAPLPRRIADPIERSSLGTPAAKAARESVSDEQVASVMRRVRELSAVCTCGEPLSEHPAGPPCAPPPPPGRPHG